MFVDFNILNQLGSPSINSNTFANRPSAGQVGRLFVSTDTFEIYRDTGTGWDLIGGPGSSTVTGSGAAGQVTYWTGTNSVGGENNLWWDAANNHFGINTSTPGVALDVHSAADVGVQLNGTGATPSILQQFLSAGVAQYEIGYNWNSDINYRRFAIYDVQGSKEVISIDQQSRYVGINYQYSSLTDQPAYTLDVSGSVRGADTSFFATNPSSYLLVGSTTLSPTNEALQVTGTAIVSSSVKGASFIPTGNTIPTNGMYLSNTNEISFATNSAQIINVNASGNTGMGIGGTTPASRLHVSGDITQQTSLNIAGQFFIISRKSRGTVASPTTVLVNDDAGGILFSGYDGATWRSGAGIRAQIQAVSVGSLSSNLGFAAGNGSISGATIRMTMRGDTGNVLIGSTTDLGQKLQVNGVIYAATGLNINTTSTDSAQLKVNGSIGVNDYNQNTYLYVTGGVAGQRVSAFVGSYAASSSVTLATFSRVGGAVSADIKYDDSLSPLGISYGTTTNHALYFFTNNTNALLIKNDQTAEFTQSIKTAAPTTGTAAETASATTARHR